MICSDFRKQITDEYSVVRVISNKNESLSLLVKHKSLGKYMVLRQFNNSVPVYDFLNYIRFENLPIVYESIHLDDGHIVLEEYIDGLSVAEVLENGTYTYSGARKVLYDVCDALKILHINGFVHRDIKPENIMISKNGIVKLIDFNASRTIKSNASKDTVQIGTIGYAAPEQLGLSQSDTRTDIYALGVLLNVMLTGEHPSKKLAKGRAGKIVLKSTQIDPKSRFKNVDEFKIML